MMGSDSLYRVGISGERLVRIARRSMPLLAILWAGGAEAQTYTVQSITAPVFGTLAAGTTGNTVFLNNGTLTRQSGTGAIITGAITRAAVTIQCTDGSGGGNACSNGANVARVTVATSGVTSGRALAISQFTAASGTGTVGTGTTSGAGPLDFQFSGWTGAGSLTFFLDTTLPIAGDDVGGTTGAATSGFAVKVVKNPTVPSVGLTALATATVRKSLQITKLTDLQLGTLVRPATGSGTVTINATTGLRTTGGANPPVGVTGPASGRATYTLTGEPSSTFTINIPASATLTSGANTIALTLTNTASGAQTMPVGGSLALGIGGSATITSTTASGSYSTSFVVTITYN
jgi:hypothetical protein